MKKFLYLIVLGLALQSCLNDKEHESDIFKSVGRDLNVVEFGTLEKSPKTNFRITAVDVNSVPEIELPSIGIVLKPGVQSFEIPVDLPIRALKKDLIVKAKYDIDKIAAYNATRLVEYNVRKATYDRLLKEYKDIVAINNTVPAPSPLLVVPAFPEVPALFNPFLPLPVGKFTISPSTTIKAGDRSASLTLTLADPLADISLLNRYMLVLTLESGSADVRVANPTTLISVAAKKFSPYVGTFAYTGVQRYQTLTAGPPDYATVNITPNTVIHSLVESSTIPGAYQMALGGAITPTLFAPASNTQFRMNVRFDPNATDPEDRVIILGASAATSTFTLTLLPLVISKIVKKPGDPELKLIFDDAGNLDEIKNLWYIYTGGNGDRQFRQSSIKRVEDE